MHNCQEVEQVTALLKSFGIRVTFDAHGYHLFYEKKPFGAQLHYGPEGFCLNVRSRGVGVAGAERYIQELSDGQKILRSLAVINPEFVAKDEHE